MFWGIIMNNPNTWLYIRRALDRTYPSEALRLYCSRSLRKKYIESRASRHISVYILTSWEKAIWTGDIANNKALRSPTSLLKICEPTT